MNRVIRNQECLDTSINEQGNKEPRMLIPFESHSRLPSDNCLCSVSRSFLIKQTQLLFLCTQQEGTQGGLFAAYEKVFTVTAIIIIIIVIVVVADVVIVVVVVAVIIKVVAVVIVVVFVVVFIIYCCCCSPCCCCF